MPSLVSDANQRLAFINEKLMIPKTVNIPLLKTAKGTTALLWYFQKKDWNNFKKLKKMEILESFQEHFKTLKGTYNLDGSLGWVKTSA